MNYRTKEFRSWTFGGLTYTRKQDVVSKFQKIKKGEQEDDAFMRDLLQRHPDAFGEIDRVMFVPHETENFGDLGMRVRMIDGRMWNYPSYKACLVPDKALELDGGADWYEKYFISKEAPTMRMVIQYQLDEFRYARREGDDTCDMCGAPTYDGDVDHITPFKDIYLDWLQMNNMKPGEVEFSTVTTDGLKQITDASLSCSWDAHHQMNFNPQWLCKPCHRSKK